MDSIRVSTWLYPYNADAFESAFGTAPEELGEGDLGHIVAWGLGYVDYSKGSIVSGLVSNRHDSRGGCVEVDTWLEGPSVEAFRQGLAEAVPAYGSTDEFTEDEMGAMVAYAIGFIDFEVLAREYPGRRANA